MALVGILDGAHAVDAVGGIHIADARIVLHQGEQEAGGPVFVDPHIGIFVHEPCDNRNAVVGIGKPCAGDFRFGNHKQGVQEKAVFAVGAQIEGVKPLERFHPHAGQIADA